MFQSVFDKVTELALDERIQNSRGVWVVLRWTERESASSPETVGNREPASCSHAAICGEIAVVDGLRIWRRLRADGGPGQPEVGSGHGDLATNHERLFRERLHRRGRRGD